jgi:hypothetical protein
VAIAPKRGLTRRTSPSAGGMIVKTFFLAKIIHRIGTRNLRQKKSLPENLAGYRVFFTLRAARQARTDRYPTSSCVPAGARPYCRQRRVHGRRTRQVAMSWAKDYSAKARLTGAGIDLTITVLLLP